VLNFETGPQRIKVIVQYKDYKKFGSETTIKFGDQEVQGPQSSQPNAPPPNQAPAPPNK
jgi:hypothetical protein